MEHVLRNKRSKSLLSGTQPQDTDPWTPQLLGHSPPPPRHSRPHSVQVAQGMSQPPPMQPRTSCLLRSLGQLQVDPEAKPTALVSPMPSACVLLPTGWASGVPLLW